MKPEIRVQVARSGTKENPYEIRLIGPHGWTVIDRGGKLKSLGRAENIAYALGVKAELLE